MLLSCPSVNIHSSDVQIIAVARENHSHSLPASSGHNLGIDSWTAKVALTDGFSEEGGLRGRGGTASPRRAPGPRGAPPSSTSASALPLRQLAVTSASALPLATTPASQLDAARLESSRALVLHHREGGRAPDPPGPRRGQHPVSTASAHGHHNGLPGPYNLVRGAAPGHMAAHQPMVINPSYYLASPYHTMPSYVVPYVPTIAPPTYTAPFYNRRQKVWRKVHFCACLRAPGTRGAVAR